MSGEFEPNDSRNVTGTASTPDGRWTAQGQQPPEANGQSPQHQAGGANDGQNEAEEDEELDGEELEEDGSEGGDEDRRPDQPAGEGFGSNGS